MELANAWIALAGTLFGGAGFKILEAILGRAGRQDTTATSIRTELRLEISNLRVEMQKLKEEAHELAQEVDKWRDRYYSLVAAIASGDLQEAMKRIRGDNV